MIRLWGAQILAVLRLEIRKTFLARRGLWVYLLALAPVVMFAANSIIAPRREARLRQIAQTHPVSRWRLFLLPHGMTRAQVVDWLGEPYSRRTQYHHFAGEERRRDVFHYTDGSADVTLVFFQDNLVRVFWRLPETLDQQNTVFATIFQFYYLRLAVFFGCVGIFMNLFRGEMIDRSLHYYLLTPMRREVLLAGKFLAGLIATVGIFTCGTALQLLALLWQFHGPVAHAYLQGPGWGHVGAYLGVTALACAGYGSVFLAAGLLFRNPIVPAAIALVWESANVFVPAALKKLSLIYYLQSLCPVVAVPEGDMSLPLRLLLATSEPPGTLAALTGLGLLILAVLLAAAFQARKLQINYATE